MTDTIYDAPRGTTFKKLITELLEKGNIRPKYIDIMTNEENMRLFSQAFTSPTSHATVNYEIYEQLGDLSANKFIVWYTYKRFPQLKCAKGVKIAARIRINYGSKQSFYKIAETYGFWDFISASHDERQHKKKSLMEDSLEAFLGCTESIMDDMYQPGVGYGIVYDILKHIFDKIDISLAYTDLYDAKTRMKELFDAHKQGLGNLHYLDRREGIINTSQVYQIPPGAPKDPIKRYVGNEIELLPPDTWVLIGTGRAAIKPDSQQRAAEEGLKYLNRRGWVKAIPEEYKLFCS